MSEHYDMQVNIACFDKGINIPGAFVYPYH